MTQENIKQIDISQTLPATVGKEEGAMPTPTQTSDLVMLRLMVMFPPEQEEQVREILNQNHFMRIVRKLKAVGIDVDFSRVDTNEA